MNKIVRNRWVLELVWWTITILVTILVLLPVYNNVENYPFYAYNIFFIITFLTFIRYIFLLRLTPMIYSAAPKLITAVLCIPILFMLFQGFYLYQAAVNEYGPEDFFNIRINSDPAQTVYYIHSEMVLFAVGAIITATILPFRMLMSVWKTKNRGTY